MSAICSTHGKSRTLANLESDGYGGMKCVMGRECQGGGGGGGQKRSAAAMSMPGMPNSPMMQMMAQMMGMGPGPAAKKQKPEGVTAICTLHGKNRSLKSMQEDGAGGYCCAPGYECKVGSGDGSAAMVGGAGEQMICSLHGKKRSTRSMMADGAGGMCCAPGYECQLGSEAAADGNAICSVHNKNRSIRSLIDDGVGGYCCAPGYECQMGTGGKNTGAMPTIGGAGSGTCSLHGKTRSFKSLIEDGSGGYCCAPGMTCQIGKGDTDEEGLTEQYQCSVHGKMRSLQSLEDDGEGGYKCAAGFQCQVGGKAGGKAGGPKHGLIPPMNPMAMMQQMNMMAAQLTMMKGKLGAKGGSLGKGGKSCAFCKQGMCWMH